MVEPIKDGHHQLIGDPLPAPFFDDVYPLQLVIAVEAARTMGCDEADDLLPIDSDEDGTLR